MNFKQMLRILEASSKKATPAELRHAEQLLRQAGYKVEGPTGWNGGKVTPAASPFTRRKPTPGQTTPLPLPGWEDRPQTSPGRDTCDDDLLQGTMYEVESSNVHSIGMRIDNPGDRTGTLLVRFLGQHEKGVRSGVGSLYEYYSVPVSLFRDFQRAASKGGFVWDHLRVRGTIAGHRDSYELVGIAGAFVASLGKHVENYVPRAASLRKGLPGQHFVKRTHHVGEIRQGRMQRIAVESQLQGSQASMRGPNPERGPGAEQMRFMAGNVNRQGGQR